MLSGRSGRQRVFFMTSSCVKVLDLIGRVQPGTHVITRVSAFRSVRTEKILVKRGGLDSEYRGSCIFPSTASWAVQQYTSFEPQGLPSSPLLAVPSLGHYQNLLLHYDESISPLRRQRQGSTTV